MRLLLVSVLALCPRPALAEKPVVAVFEIQDMRLKDAKLKKAKRAALTDLLRNFLAEGGSFKVVPQSGLRRAMLDAKKESAKECFDEACQIEIGKAVSASKFVTTKIIQVGGQCIVTSTLFDLRSETTDRAEHSKGDCAEESLAVTLERVATKLKADRAHAELESEEKQPPPERWDPGRKKKVIVSFRSVPPGALVMIDGDLACQDSSAGCRKALATGKHSVSMQKERYSPRSQEVFIESSTEIAWEMEPNFSQVQIRTDPPDLEVRVDGRSIGRTPIQPDLEPGEHLIELADRCYHPSEQRVTVLRGRSEQIDLESVPREGAIDVSAIDESGNAVPADVFVDGKHAGRAPDLIRVNVCAKTVRVTSDDQGAWEGSLAIGERQTLEIEAKLRKGGWENEPEGDPEPAKQEAPPPPGIGLRVGAQAMMGILCLDDTKIAGPCTNRLTGYGGLIGLRWPTNRAPPENGWFFRGSLRAGFLYYPGSGLKPAVFEVPAGLAAELGLSGEALEYGVGGEAIYVFRQFAKLVEPFPATEEELLQFEARRNASPHAFDLGVYAVLRMIGFEFGGGIYLPVTGIGGSVLGRIWLGYAYDL